MTGTLRTKSGWLRAPALDKGLSEQQSWIDDDGARHTVYLSRPRRGGRFSVHHDVTLNGVGTDCNVAYYEGLNQARKAFKKEAKHG